MDAQRLKRKKQNTSSSCSSLALGFEGNNFKTGNRALV